MLHEQHTGFCPIITVIRQATMMTVSVVHPLEHRLGVMGSNLGSNHVIAKDVLIVTFCCYDVRYTTFLLNAVDQNRRNSTLCVHSELGLTDKGDVIKGLIVCKI